MHIIPTSSHHRSIRGLPIGSGTINVVDESESTLHVSILAPEANLPTFIAIQSLLLGIQTFAVSSGVESAVSPSPRPLPSTSIHSFKHRQACGTCFVDEVLRDNYSQAFGGVAWTWSIVSGRFAPLNNELTVSSLHSSSGLQYRIR